MDEAFLCECGCDELWYFGKYVRCPKCFTEMMMVLNVEAVELEHWLRRWSITEDNPCGSFSNWEKIPNTPHYRNKDIRETL